VAEASAGQGGARGDPFIGGRGEGSSGARWTPVRCTTTELMLHSGGDETARWGGAVQGRGHSSEDEAVPNFSVWRGDGVEERTVVGGDRGEAVRSEGMGWLTGGVSLSAVRERERERGWRRLAGGVGLSAGAITRAEWAGGGPRGGVGSREREGGSGRGCGPRFGPARGEKGFSFF
jgi:hypothetical protein